jgi:hypothetical protein
MRKKRMTPPLLLSSFCLLSSRREKRKERSVDIQKTCFTVIVVVFFRSFFLFFFSVLSAMHWYYVDDRFPHVLCSFPLFLLLYIGNQHVKKEKKENIFKVIMPVLKKIYEERAHKYRDEDVLSSVLFSSAFNIYYIYTSNTMKEKQNILQFIIERTRCFCYCCCFCL